MIFYHIDRTKHIKQNQTISYIKLPATCDEQIINYCDKHFKNQLSNIGFVYTGYATSNNKYYSNYSAEIFLELYRQSHFSDLPSRFQSICASDSLEQSYFWYKELNIKDCNIVVFNTEKYLKVDAAWRDLISGNLSIATVESWSYNYWSGKTFGNEPRVEYLLPLPLKVENIIISPFK